MDGLLQLSKAVWRRRLPALPLVYGAVHDCDYGADQCAGVPCGAGTDPEDVYKRQILDGLNMALEKIYEADPSFAQKLYEKNFPSASNTNVLLSEEEQKYVRRKVTATVAIPRDWHPLFCLDNSDGHDGVVPELLGKITGYSGLDVYKRQGLLR